MGKDHLSEVMQVFDKVKHKIVSHYDFKKAFNALAAEKLSKKEKVYRVAVEAPLTHLVSLSYAFNHQKYEMAYGLPEPYKSLIGDGSAGTYVRKSEKDKIKPADWFQHAALDIRLSTRLEELSPFKEMQRKFTQLTAKAYEQCNDYTGWKDQGLFVPIVPTRSAYGQDTDAQDNGPN